MKKNKTKTVYLRKMTPSVDDMQFEEDETEPLSPELSD